jgi:hypothetical protein
VAFAGLFEAMKDLETLELANLTVSLLTDANLAPVLGLVPQLKHLTLREARCGDATLQALIPLVGLETLALLNNAAVSARGLETVVNACSRLKTVSLLGNSGVDNDAVAVLARLPMLNHLDLSRCGSLFITVALAPLALALALAFTGG